MNQDGMRAFVFSGKAEHLLPGIADGSVDAVITDPPYGLAEMPAAMIVKALTAWLGGDRMHVPDGKGFMGKDWDRFVPPPGIWDECYRILKPGGHMAVFAGTRTADLMGLSLRLAGLEIRDTLSWLYGQGFPKSRTHLKPAQEPILLCRKPFSGSEAANVLAHGTGALNPAACTVAHASAADLAESSGKNRHADFSSGPRQHNGTYQGMPASDRAQYDGSAGRWAPNLLLTHDARCRRTDQVRVVQSSEGVVVRKSGTDGTGNTSAAYGAESRAAGTPRPGYGREEVAVWDCAPGCPVAGLDAQSGGTVSRIGKPRKSAVPGDGYGMTHTGAEYADAGGASRFFPQFAWDPEYDLPFLYQAKAPKSERPRIEGATGHPTVKPLALMRWLARLLCPPDGLICDPFGGTMTTVQAALLEDFRAVAADSWPSAIAHARVRLADIEGVVFGCDTASGQDGGLVC